jgi:hypothetical protein
MASLYSGSEDDYLQSGVETDETLEDVFKETIMEGRTRTTLPKRYFGRKEGTHGFVVFSYLNADGMPPRFPDRKELTIKQVYIYPSGTNTVNTTCDKLLRDPDTKPYLNKIIIESIQSQGWEKSLQRNGWTIIESEGPSNAEKKRGGRKIIENNETTLSNFEKKQTRTKRKKKRRTRRH